MSVAVRELPFLTVFNVFAVLQMLLVHCRQKLTGILAQTHVRDVWATKQLRDAPTDNRKRTELYLLAVWRTHPALRVVARSGVASYLTDLVMP